MFQLEEPSAGAIQQAEPLCDGLIDAEAEGAGRVVVSCHPRIEAVDVPPPA